MVSTRNQASRVESIISFLLLVLLGLVAVITIIIQSDFNLDRFGITTAGTFSSTSSQQKEGPHAVYKLDGFVPISQAQKFIADNLYEKINGKAPMYIDAGFVELTTQLLALEDDDQLQAELYLYDMGSAKNAFAIYSIQKRPDGQILPGFDFGYKTANALYFVRDKYYVELIGFTQDDRLAERMVYLASILLKDKPAAVIPELDYFPDKYLIPASYKLYPASAFGCENLKDVFTADYNLTEANGTSGKLTAFFTRRADPSQAVELAETYYEFLLSVGAEPVELTSGIPDIRILDIFGYTEVIFTTDVFVAGVHQADNQQLAVRLAEMLFEKLSSISSGK